MKLKLTVAIIGLALAGTMVKAQALPVDVSYTVSGSAGAWTLDFTVTNNLGGTNDLYYFGVELPVQNITGTPSGWFNPLLTLENWSGAGGSSIDYNNLWKTCTAAVCPPGSVINPGDSLSGFKVFDTDLTLPSGVNWFAVASGGNYPGPGCSFICFNYPLGAPLDNPGFEGTAVADSIPEPASAALLLGPFLLLLGRRAAPVVQNLVRRRRGQNPVFAA